MGTSATAAFETIRRSKVYEEVARQIQNHIFENLKPGDVLPAERELAQKFGVSRSSVRDAIRSLELIGLLEPQQGRGTVVCEPTASAVAGPLTAIITQKRKLVSELLDFRKIIEPPLAARAALHATPEQIAEVKQTVERQAEKVRKGELAIEEDNQFHYQIATAADNSIVFRILDVLMDMLRETRQRSLQTSGRPQKSLAGHRRILAALEQRDAAASQSAMLRHLEEIEKIVLPTQ